MKDKKNHESIWEDCLKVIKDNISLQSFKTWFEPIVPIRFKNKVLTLTGSFAFFLRVVRRTLY
jgi:chromosomal replication initiator protein